VLAPEAHIPVVAPEAHMSVQHSGAGPDPVHTPAARIPVQPSGGPAPAISVIDLTEFAPESCVSAAPASSAADAPARPRVWLVRSCWEPP
jgi:hypothetical protein